MALPFFGSYLAALLVLTIVLAMAAKNLAEGMAAHGKKPFVYGGLSSIIVSALAWGIGFLTRNLFLSYWILSALFLAFGMVHQWLVKHKYFYALHHNKSKVMMGEILFGLSIIAFTLMVFSSLQYFLKGEKQYLFYPMLMSTLFFFVPMLFQNLYEAAISIPAKEYTPWTYPLYSQLEIPEEDPRERVLVIGFEMNKHEQQKVPTYFRSKAPENIKLGHLFYFFINDYNELHPETPISVTDENQMPCNFLFSKKKKWYQRAVYYNGERNFRENGILENTVIKAVRC